MFVTDGNTPIEDHVYDCTSAASGVFYLTGLINEDMDFGTGPTVSVGGGDSFLAALAANGQGLWTRSLGGVGKDQGRGVALAEQVSVLYALDEYSDVLTQGGTERAVGLQDILITGHDPTTGALKWSLPIGSLSNDGIYASAVDASGNLVFAGYHRAAIRRGVTSAEGSLSGLGTFLGSVSPEGKLLWVTDLADLKVSDMAVAQNGDIYVVGETVDAIVTPTQTLSPVNGAVDGFLVKLEWP